ncbi:Amidase [Penicillium herquei]|nr:Amidase [Penicillium herquei]
MPTQYGSPIYKGHQSCFDSSAVAILRDAGALIFGKTTTTEFTVINSGPETTNPRDPNLVVSLRRKI